jgi:hypothetical protein
VGVGRGGNRVGHAVDDVADAFNDMAYQARRYGNSSADELIPGTPEHKSARWMDYQNRYHGQPPLDYSKWSNVYDANMINAKLGNAAADAYHQIIGWGEREVAIEVSPGINRILDIADVRTQRAIEYKTGYRSNDEFLRGQYYADALLVQDGWDITWVFEISTSQQTRIPSDNLRIALTQLGIKWELRQVP